MVSSSAAACALIMLFPSSDAFIPPIIRTKHELQSLAATVLNAKKKARRQGRRGRRGKHQADDGEPPATQETLPPPIERAIQIPKPSKTKKSLISFDLPAQPQPRPPLEVCVVEVTDPKWWQDAADNDQQPYGARLWPPSLAIAQFLAEHLTKKSDDPEAATDERQRRRQQQQQRQSVLELGAGTGLISLVAAGVGADALATDISPVALKLTRDGWAEMTRRRRRSSLQKPDLTTRTNEEEGTLSTATFDLFSPDPLPIQPKRQADDDDSDDALLPQPIVVAAAVLYDGDLGVAVARRVYEACAAGAWVILGDDDTGLRDNGRSMFEDELVRLQQQDGGASGKTVVPLRRLLIKETVRKKEFGWTEKNVRVHHFNAPPGVRE